MRLTWAHAQQLQHGVLSVLGRTRLQGCVLEHALGTQHHEGRARLGARGQDGVFGRLLGVAGGLHCSMLARAGLPTGAAVGPASTATSVSAVGLEVVPWRERVLRTGAVFMATLSSLLARTAALSVLLNICLACLQPCMDTRPLLEPPSAP